MGVIKQAATRPGATSAAAVAFICGGALLVGSLILAVVTGIVSAELAASLNLGGDSAAFGDGADGFVVGAFIGFLASFIIGGVLIAVAIAREFSARLVVTLAAVFAPLACLLLLLLAAF
jgi:hypothetical protein